MRRSDGWYGESAPCCGWWPRTSEAAGATGSWHWSVWRRRSGGASAWSGSGDRRSRAPPLGRSASSRSACAPGPSACAVRRPSEVGAALPTSCSEPCATRAPFPLRSKRTVSGPCPPPGMNSWKQAGSPSFLPSPEGGLRVERTTGGEYRKQPRGGFGHNDRRRLDHPRPVPLAYRLGLLRHSVRHSSRDQEATDESAPRNHRGQRGQRLARRPSASVPATSPNYASGVRPS